MNWLPVRVDPGVGVQALACAGCATEILRRMDAPSATNLANLDVFMT